MKQIIAYFSNRHLIAHVLFSAVIIMAIFIWNHIGKEEMPEFASNWIRVTTRYPGAAAEDVELFVTKPIEDELKGVVGIEEVSSTSSVGVSSFRIVIDDNYPDKDEVVQGIKDAVLRVNYPSEVRDLPSIRQFKSSEKAILDIGLYIKGQRFLDVQSRKQLQEYVLGFENQLLSLPEISSIERSYYRKPELQIIVDTQQKSEMLLSLSEIRNQIVSSHVRSPLGSMHDKQESKVTAINEYETVDSFSDLILRGSYEGQGIKLKDIATVREGFERVNSIFKINGHEGIFLNVRKSVSTDILTAQDKVKKAILKFKTANKDNPIQIVLMDDESYAVTNRLDIIAANGVMGFILIILVLFIFLDLKSGFWVAMGVPFSMAFTLLLAHLAGYTVNNMTLAGIIIVLGIVVDDAIIIAENISQKWRAGIAREQAAIQGTVEVVRPIAASILTTCVAFLPLVFFEGFFGKLVAYIPLIVCLMLLGSLVESLFILPSHISGPSFILDKFSSKDPTKHWFNKYEKLYERFLLKILNARLAVIGFFVLLLLSGGYIFHSKMKFVMFPREESKEVVVRIKAPKDATRLETATLISPLEDHFAKDLKNVVGVRSRIGESRRGGEIKDNEARILIELHPADQRDEKLVKILERWENFAKSVDGLDEVKFLKGRWGHDSGAAVEIQVLENNDKYRDEITRILERSMNDLEYLADVEIEAPLVKREFLIKLKQDQMIRYDVRPESVTSALRTFIEGSILYSINKGNEEVDVRLSVEDKNKENLDELLKLRIENKQGQLIYFSNIVSIEEVKKPVNISRANYKRSTMIYANIKDGAKITPLEIARSMEENVFPDIQRLYPSSVLLFRGEIEDTRESQGEFINSVYAIVFLIYLILVIMFNSLIRPFLVLSCIPVGVAGVVFILVSHNMSIFGFFAVIGALGMIGVVVNDAIVMIDKLDKKDNFNGISFDEIAEICGSRLRPILVTTITTVVGVLPTAYGIAGYDSMLAEMMLTMGWGLVFGTLITLVLIPCLYSFKGHTKA